MNEVLFTIYTFFWVLYTIIFVIVIIISKKKIEKFKKSNPDFIQLKANGIFNTILNLSTEIPKLSKYLLFIKIYLLIFFLHKILLLIIFLIQ